MESKDEEDDEFYTLEEIVNFNNKTMAYMARKFKNLIFPKSMPFKANTSFRNYNRGVSSNPSEVAKKKNGYKYVLVNMYKIRCYNCSDLGHFATECEKLKQPRKGEGDYEELKNKYDAFLRKQQGKYYVAEGKCWDDIDEDDDEEYGNYALMAHLD